MRPFSLFNMYKKQVEKLAIWTNGNELTFDVVCGIIS